MGVNRTGFTGCGKSESAVILSEAAEADHAADDGQLARYFFHLGKQEAEITECASSIRGRISQGSGIPSNESMADHFCVGVSVRNCVRTDWRMPQIGERSGCDPRQHRKAFEWAHGPESFGDGSPSQAGLG